MNKKMKVKVPWSDPLYGKANRIQILHALAAAILKLQFERDPDKDDQVLTDLIEGKGTMDLEVKGDQTYFIDQHFMDHPSISRDLIPCMHILLDQVEPSD
jgi:hypothetical protein